jgi:DNA-binding beta-propeller fold protein YncE
MSTEIRIGEEFAGYRIDSLLGRGGMGTVYLARHLRLDRAVALKVLDPALAADERFRERFLRESRAAAAMNHPNVVPLYDADQVGDVLFLAMRYVEGGDLGSLLRDEGPLEPERAVAIVGQVASALDAAHARGLIHRDVKPANILVASGAGGEAPDHTYLTDFGLAKRPGSAPGITKTGQFMGSVDYAAPEQFEGKRLTPQADVYSLGCVLFECLTGEPPFSREQEAAVMYAHLSEPPPAVTAARPSIPAAMNRVVAKAMAKRSEDRYAHAGQLAAAAREALPGTRAPTAPPGTTRRRLAALAVAGVLVAGGVAAGLVALLSGRAPTPSPSATGPPASGTPTGAAVAPAGVARIDPETGTVVARIASGGTFFGYHKANGFITPQWKSLAVTRAAVWTGVSGAKINPGQDAVVATEVPGIGWPLAAGADTVWSIVAGDPSTPAVVIGVDAETNRATHRIRVPNAFPQVTGLAVGAGSVWVAAQDLEGPAVWRLDPGRDRVEKVFHLGGATPSAVAFGGGRFWFLDSVQGSVSSIDPHTSEVSAPILLAGNPSNLAAGAGAIWVLDGNADTVTRIPLEGGGAGIQTIPVGKSPVALAIGEGFVWVLNRGDGTVSKIDPAGVNEVDRIHVGPGRSCGWNGRLCRGGLFDIAVGAGGVWVADLGGG